MKLRPFFYYFGAKYMQAKRYPAPEHDTIIESFAGSAGYATHYFDRKVILYEVDPCVAGIWMWLLSVSADDVRRLPLIEAEDCLDDAKFAHLEEEAKALIGFRIVVATAVPGKKPAVWMKKKLANPVHSPENYVAWGDTFWCDRVRERIAQQVDHIRHWRIVEKSYDAAPDIEATWYIDPPYSGPGKHYKHHKIDYGKLAGWCKSRRGQVIVCEQAGASWLPFQPLAEVKSTKGTSKEVMWYRSDLAEEEIA